MTIRSIWRAVFLVGVASGCAAPEPSAGPAPTEWRTLATAEELEARVIGRVLSYDNGLQLVLTPDGGFESPNQAVSGERSFDNGLYCREITVAGRAFPQECHALQVSVDGARFRGVNADGTGRSEATIGS